MAVTASLRLAASVALTGTEVLNKKPSWADSFDEVLSFADGTSANQCDLAYLAERTVASASNDDIDVRGVLADALGSTINAAELVAIAIVNKQKNGSANTTNLTIGAGSNTVPGFANALAALKPGGMFMMVSPDAAGLATVTAGTGDIIRVANSSGATAKYMVALLARSA